MIDDAEFALCLTHDVDRPYKTYQAIFYALRDRRISHLADLLPSRNPYWQFEEIMNLEADLGVRSAFYVLNEPQLLYKRLRTWVQPDDWVQQLGRYNIDDPAIRSIVRRLEADGWEIGLHGSFRSHTDVDRLRDEKRALESHLESPILGGRQHYLKLAIPETWRHHAAIGLRYDASLGSSRTFGFRHGYRPLRPFDDDFVVFPLTVMESALPDPGDEFEAAWSACEGLLDEAAENGATMSALWHPRYFSETEFPGYRRLYRRLVEGALDRGAWVGSPGECYRSLDLDRDCATVNPEERPL